MEQDPALHGRVVAFPSPTTAPASRHRHRRAERAWQQQPAGPGEGERQPADRERQVRAVVERPGRPGGGEPEQHRQRRPTGGGDAEGETGQRTQPDPDLGDRDEQADRHGEWLGEGDHGPDRRVPSEGSHLAVDRCRVRRVEEGRIEQLVEARVEERDGEEDPEREQGRRADRQRRQLHPERRSHRSAIRSAGYRWRSDRTRRGPLTPVGSTATHGPAGVSSRVRRAGAPGRTG